MPAWSLDALFNEAYLELYAPYLPAEKTRAQAGLIVDVLGVAPGELLLDVCCGHGRHVAALRELGQAAFGVDLSALFVELATRGGGHFVRGDVRALPIATESIAGAYCWFTSIGYGDREDDERTFAEVARALRPGRRFAVETNRWAHVAAAAASASDGVSRHRSEIEGGFLEDESRYDPDARRVFTRRRYAVGGAEPTEVEFSVAAYDAGDLAEMLTDAGFASVDLRAGNGDALADDSRRVLAIGTKP